MESVRDALIVGSADRNRAMHGDIVAVQLYPEAQWRPRDASITSTTTPATADTPPGRPMPTGYV